MRIKPCLANSINNGGFRLERKRLVDPNIRFLIYSKVSKSDVTKQVRDDGGFKFYTTENGSSMRTLWKSLFCMVGDSFLVTDDEFERIYLFHRWNGLYLVGRFDVESEIHRDTMPVFKSFFEDGANIVDKQRSA